MPPGAYSGMPVSPAYFSCSIYGDGIPVQISRDAGEVETNLGWMSSVDLRNSIADADRARKEKEARDAQQTRPRLCYPDIPRYGKKRGKCFFTDTTPYSLVP